MSQAKRAWARIDIAKETTLSFIAIMSVCIVNLASGPSAVRVVWSTATAVRRVGPPTLWPVRKAGSPPKCFSLYCLVVPSIHLHKDRNDVDHNSADRNVVDMAVGFSVVQDDADASCSPRAITLSVRVRPKFAFRDSSTLLNIYGQLIIRVVYGLLVFQTRRLQHESGSRA